jgi:hypothetical protein
MLKKRTKRESRERINVPRLWEEIEEEFYPGRRVGLGERVLYFHLLRLTRLAGKRLLNISVPRLALALSMSKNGTRNALYGLAKNGAVRLLQHNRAGHYMEVKLPREIPGYAPDAETSAMEQVCWSKGRENRRAIFEREGHHCFYCGKPLGVASRALDHVVPQVYGGGDSYRNVVACCTQCNSAKKTATGEEFLRRLFLEGMLGRKVFFRRIRVLEELKQGKLKPEMKKNMAD